MSNDYLWDGSGTPDPDVQRLEALLGGLRAPLAPAPALPDAPLRWRTLRYLGPLLATAAAVLVMIGVTWQTRQLTAPTSSTSSSWEVASLAGQPRVGAAALAGTGRIAVGQTLITDGGSQARMTVATIGQVTIDTNTRVRLVATRDGHHQLALERGTLHAVINAPPGQFVVNTPSATATDLGCAYTLHVDEDGAGLLSVSSGWVALELNGRESLVPVGASCRTDPDRGPGTPSYDDADPALREALDAFDEARNARVRAETLRAVLEHAGPGDAVTLWHLISRVDEADRAMVVDRLADLLPMPSGVTREAVLALDRIALDQWWNALGLGEASWWRNFKAPM
jgi:ferric-dicitrate binding protein FerR (iron transport regulator)